MREIIVLNYASLDNFIAKIDDSTTDWTVWDAETDDYYKETQESADTMIFGRTTFETMRDYWGTSKSAAEKPEIIEFMNETKKIVFSKSLLKADWTNSELLGEIIPAEIEKLKRQSGKNIVIYGSASVVAQLTKLNLIDEYRIMINPVVLGSGKPYFQDLAGDLKLQLLETRTFKIGNVLLRYEPKMK